MLLIAEAGKMMARYGVAFDSMQLFSTLVENLSPASVLNLLSGAKEFADIHLRMSERKILNELNKPPSKSYTGANLKYAIHSRACCID